MQMTQTEKDFIHGESVEQARSHLETLMDKAVLPEVSRERLRDAFRGTTNIAGMRQAVNVERRMGVTK